MKPVSYREIAARFVSAFRLMTRPLAIYGTETLPPGTLHLSDVNRCFAVSLYRMATETEVSALYVSADRQEGCCPGGLYHVGYIPVPDDIKYFVSTGKEDVRCGAAEFLKARPDLVESCTRAAGPIRPPGKYLIVQACETLPDTEPAIKAICCFGDGEQIRNMAALVHFDRDEPFSPVIVPWGSACSTYITFPAWLAARTPHDTAFMGPQDPTLNYSLPPGMMAMGIPADLAARMERNLDSSFVVRRPHVAFPDHRQRRQRTG
jgi:hypothetical protein